jgi:integrase
MARPKKTDAPDLTLSHDLTAGVIERLQCPPEKPQVFLRDSKSPSLRVRATPPSTKNPRGVKAFVFEAKLNRATIRTTIGDVRAWTIEDARAEANRLRVVVDSGKDPRELSRQELEAKAAEAAAASAKAVTFGEAWNVYVAERWKYWGERHGKHHRQFVDIGGEPYKRGKGVTKAGPMAEFVPFRLADLTSDILLPWAEREARDRPAYLRQALRALKAFLKWCEEEPRYKGVVDAKAISKKVREAAGKPQFRNDCLQKEQLPTWFEQVRMLPNPIISAYLQTLLITGARKEEIATLRWEDVNFQWRYMTINDKVEDTRQVPLTPYVEQLLSSLPRVNEWVFASFRTLLQDDKNKRRRALDHAQSGTQAPKAIVVNRSESGHLAQPGAAHSEMCKSIGLELTLHGLRRSFASLCEWLDIPGGISAQIQGHAPQGVREQNYIRRPLDLLRHHHERIEAWILEQAGIEFKAPAAKLALVK